MKKSILLICPYDNIYPPMNGGMQRCFHIIHQLSKYFKLTVIMNQEKDKFLSCVSLYPSINNINIYSTFGEQKKEDFFDYLPIKYQSSLRYRWLRKTVMESADGNFLKYYPVLKKLLKINKYDTVILENLSTIKAVNVIKSFDKKINIIYNAHNVDSNLALENYNNGKIGKKNFLSIKKQESNFYKNVNSILVCSNIDKITFDFLNKNRLPINVVPNGVEIHPILRNENKGEVKPKYILFCGSLNYEPNVEGLIWFYKNCWPSIQFAFTTLKFLVLGSGSVPSVLIELKNDSSVIFTGSVPFVQPYYDMATVAIAPLLSGSGTRLKILEAMSFGLPIVSTSKGAEGIKYTNNKNIVIADDANVFSNEILSMLNDKKKRTNIQNSGRELINELYNWDVIGDKLSFLI